MCVAVAKKIKLKNSGAENWFLYKIRDRAYDPKYTVKFNSVGEIQAVFLVDDDTDWTEGVNSAGIMLVSTALQNHEDKKDDGSKGKKSGSSKPTRNGVILRQVLRMAKLDDVVNTLKEELFTGNTFVSDGKRLFVLEISIKSKNVDKKEKDFMKNIDTSEMDNDEIKSLVMKNIQPEDYSVVVKELTKSKETLHIRTNHGILDSSAGYQPKDGDGYESSTKRYKHVMDTLSKFDDNDHPFEYLTALKNLSRNTVDKDKENRPVRLPDNDSGYWSGTIVMLTPTGTMFTIPLHAKFNDTNFNRIYKERKVHFVLLPKDLPLFEGIYKKHFTTPNYKGYL